MLDMLDKPILQRVVIAPKLIIPKIAVDLKLFAIVMLKQPPRQPANRMPPQTVRKIANAEPPVAIWSIAPGCQTLLVAVCLLGGVGSNARLTKRKQTVLSTAVVLQVILNVRQEEG